MELSLEDGRRLVRLARAAIAARLGQPVPAEAHDLEAALAKPVFLAPGASFVTLKRGGALRGCIGSLTAREPLRSNVRTNALNAAFHDPRFPPLKAEELPQLDVEVSVLTPPRRLDCHGGAGLAARLNPGRDGVVIRHGGLSATFLPQVWEQLPRPEEFLSHLCLKAGLAPDAWKRLPLEVEVYRVLSFHEDPSAEGTS